MDKRLPDHFSNRDLLIDNDQDKNNQSTYTNPKRKSEVILFLSNNNTKSTQSQAYKIRGNGNNMPKVIFFLQQHSLLGHKIKHLDEIEHLKTASNDKNSKT